MDGGGFDDDDTEARDFGNNLPDVSFLSNAEAAILLENLVATKQARPTEVFSKSLAYASANMGAVQIRDVAAVDELFNALRGMEFDQLNEDGTLTKKKLSAFEVAMLANLNPPSVAAARALVPSLGSGEAGAEGFTDDEIGEMLAKLRRSSVKFAALGDA